MGNGSSKQNNNNGSTAAAGAPDLRRQQMSSFRSGSITGNNLSIRNLFGGRSSVVGHFDVNSLKTRHSLRELEDMADLGKPEPLERLVRAWAQLLETSSSKDLHEHFYTLSPLDRQNTNLNVEVMFSTSTGNHGNVLFPTWHRVYLLKLEQALQQIDPDVTLPYWDETSTVSQQHGLPRTVTSATFTFSDGTTIPNPLRTTLLPKKTKETTDIDISVHGEQQDAVEAVASMEAVEPSAKPVSDPDMTNNTEYYDATQGSSFDENETQEITDPDVQQLNQNIVSWFTETTSLEDQHRNLITRYKKSLEAPNFMLFSNTTSQDAYNGATANEHVVSLESVHNDVHLAVAGWNGRDEYALVQTKEEQEQADLQTLLDPLFWMHLCFLDYCFWIWQKKNDLTNLSSKSKRARRAILNKDDAGTKLEAMAEIDESKDLDPPSSQGLPSFGGSSRMTTMQPGLAKKVGTQDRTATLLTLHTPLVPFAVPPGFRPKNHTSEATGSNSKFYYRSKDVIDIEQQLGYTYSRGSLDTPDILGNDAASSIDDSLGESIRSDVSQGVRVPTCSKKLVVSGLDSLLASTTATSTTSSSDGKEDETNRGSMNMAANGNNNIGGSLLVEAYAEWKGPKGLTKECLGYESIVIRQPNGACRNNMGRSSYKSSISIPLALGLDPLEYARRVTLQISGGAAKMVMEDATSTTSMASSATSESQPQYTTYQIKVKQNPENRNIYKAVIDPSDVVLATPVTASS